MRYSSSFAILSCLTALGCAAEVTAGEESASTQSQEIISGQPITTNTFGDVAIFHQEPDADPICQDDIYSPKIEYWGTNKWWPRPCSGKVIRKTGSTYYVLTARHCVTTSATIDGTPSSLATDFRVTTDTDPGTLHTVESWDPNGQEYVRVDQEPSTVYPTATVFATGSPKAGNASTGLAKDDHGEDLAILQVTGGQHFSATTGRIALSTAPVSTNSQVFSQGYGRSEAGYCTGHNTSGAGHLRWGALGGGVFPTGFSVTDVDGSGKYFSIASIPNPNGPNVKLAGGDSGSPIYTQSFTTGITTLAGVASTPSTITGSANLLKWLMTKLGNLYLIDPADYSSSTRMTGMASNTEGSGVVFNLTTDSTSTQAKYDWNTQALKFGTRCVTEVSGTVSMKTCTGGTNQVWVLNGPNIQNGASGRCLARGSSAVIASTCSSAAAQKWMFVTDNEL